MPDPSSHSLNVVNDCDGCGACCLHMGYPSFITGSDTQAAEKHWLTMPEELRSELLEFIEAYELSLIHI